MKLASFVFAATMLVLSTSQAGSAADYSAEVGVRAIARSVVAQRLVNHEARQVLRSALETGKAGFGKMECDRAAGLDYCAFDVFIKDDESTPDAEETLYRLDVIFNQGTLKSAKFELIAG